MHALKNCLIILLSYIYAGNPGKSGHLCNQDTFGGPQGIHIAQLQISHYTYVWGTFWQRGGAIGIHPPQINPKFPS